MTEIALVTQERRLKVIIASLVAPLATVPTLIVLMSPFVQTGYSTLLEAFKGTLHATFFLALFGLPVAYAVEGMLIVVTLFAGGVPATVSPRKVVSAATLAGAVTMFLLWSAYFSWGDPWTILLGAGMGLASGVTFIALRDGRAGFRKAT
jgi:hypothetical protein